MNIPGYLYFELFSLLASLTLFFRREIPLYLKLFTPFLVITLIVEIIGWKVNERQENSSFLIYPFSVLEFGFYLYTLYNVIRTPGIKKVVLYALFIYPVLALTNIYFIQVNAFPSVTYSLGCLLIVGVCIYYFYELFHLPSSVNLVREPAFWICTGLLFYYICSFPLFGLYQLLYSASNIILQNISTILTVMNALLYTLFTVGFLCGIRKRKVLYK
jgi:hypothetical protein